MARHRYCSFAIVSRPIVYSDPTVELHSRDTAKFLRHNVWHCVRASCRSVSTAVRGWVSPNESQIPRVSLAPLHVVDIGVDNNHNHGSAHELKRQGVSECWLD